MTTFVFTLTCIVNGELNYNTVEGVYFNLEEAKANASNSAKEQARIWGVQPSIFNKVIGYMTQIELKHPTLDYVKVYTLQKVEAA